MKADNDSSNSAGQALHQWQAALRQELQTLADAHLLRELRPHAGRLDFSSNDYLSLNVAGYIDQWLREAIAENPSHTGGSTGSRLIRGHYEDFDRVEEQFAAYVMTPAALLFHSGYAANVGTLDALLSPRDTVFCDRLCHASMLDGVRLSGARRYYFRHNDLADLETQLQKYAGTARRRCWILTEAVFSMDGDSPELPALCELAERYNALVYLDEAHSIGLIGPHGAGLAAREMVQDRIAVAVYPCGKAPGFMGAFVCGSAELKTMLINRARSFVFSTAQPPVLARVLARIVRYLQSVAADEARTTIQARAEKLRKALQAAGYDTGASSSHIVPVIVGEEARALELAARCQSAGLDVRAIRPPTVPKGTSRLRIILQAGHSAADVDELCDVLGRS